MPTTSDLKQLGFEKTHEIVLDDPPAADARPRFVAVPGARLATEPCVYAWAAYEHDVLEILYIGKAGQGIRRRCDQHAGGFRNSIPGRANAAALRSVLAGGARKVAVFTRASQVINLFGHATSLYATEEDALCRRFAPRLNRATFPNVSGQGDIQPAGTQPTPQPVTAQAGAGHLETLIASRLRARDEGTLDDLASQLEGYSPTDRQLLAGMLEFLETRLLQPGHELKLVGGYTDQVKGCNNVTTLGFGTLANRNFTAHGWSARIYLTEPPRIAFPDRLLKPSAAGAVERGPGIFSPKETEAFMRAPDDFILTDHPDQVPAE